jgi:hypothetical protein
VIDDRKDGDCGFIVIELEDFSAKNWVVGRFKKV